VRIAALFARDAGERPAGLRREMETTMQWGFGLFRDETAMRSGLDAVQALRERYANVYLQDKGSIFNLDLIHALQLGALLDIAWMCAEGALPRRESRGCHFRQDFPAMHNEQFLKHTILRRTTAGEMELSYDDVTIEDIEPEAEVKY